jgi:general secretion pathway protein B
VSFILDALRKSETERQRDAAAQVTRIPPARAKARLPAWIPVLMTVLAVTVLVLAGTTWRQLRSPAPSEDADTAAVATAESQPAPRSEPAAPPPKRARAAVSGAASDVPAAAGRPAPADVASAPPDATAPVATAPESVPASLPRAADLIAQGVALPALKLELHVYSDVPSERFVFINGTRYQEGQAVEDGPVVKSITPDGAVLAEQGSEFFLPVE